MKFLRKNITLKFLLFLIAISAVIFILSSFLLDISAKEEMTIFAIFLSFFILTFIGFLFFVARPLHDIAPQVKKLLTGKNYKRIRPKSPDEIGVITHFFNEVTRNLEKISVDLVQQKRLFSEIDIARKIQQDVLPKEVKNIEGLEIVARSKSAAEMGGDSFDFIQKGQNTMIYIGDVTGHGVPAGLVMMMVNTLIHAYTNNENLPHEILSMVNEVLWHRLSSQRFMTLVMLRWDSFRRKIFYTGAGHEHILIYRSETREVESIRSGGIALRMVPDTKNILVEKELALEENDVILLYTDGITEGRNKNGEMFNIDRLLASLKKHGFRSNSEKIFNLITDDFTEFVGDEFEQDDDITMIVIKYLPEKSESSQGVKLLVNSHDPQEVSGSKKWTW